MPRIDVGDEGELVVTLDEGERISLIGGGQALTVSLGEGGALTAALGVDRAPASGRAKEPNGGNGQARRLPTLPPPETAGDESEPPVPLSVTEAIAEIVNAFQQVNVRMRRAGDKGRPEPDDGAELRASLQSEAMEQVVAICRRYLLTRAE